MQLTDEQLKRFMDLYEAEMGVRIPEVEAGIAASKLLLLVEVLMKPLPLPPPKE